MGAARRSGTCRRGESRALRAAVLVAALAVLSCLAAPPVALAKDYGCPAVDMRAVVGSDASLHVTEQRTFDFDGSFTCVWWEMDGALIVNDVQIAFDGGAFHEVGEVPFETSWRTAGGPGGEAWSLDGARDTAYVFFRASDQQMTVLIDYTLPAGEAVTAYDDCGCLYWQYVASGWGADSRSVTCTIELPKPEAAAAAPGEDVRAWGHGPLDGHVAFAEDAQAVTYTVARVSAGEFAEARIVFPRAWLSDVPASGVSNRAALPGILAEEQRWADVANRTRIAALAAIAILIALSLGFVAFALVMWLRHGREYKPTFSGDYWRDVPDETAHPAAVARLWHEGAREQSDLTATILHLADIGALSIAKSGRADKRGRVAEEYYLAMNQAPEGLADPIDRAAMRLLFGTIGRNAQSFWLSDIKSYGKEHPESFSNQVDAWHDRVDAQVASRGWFEPEGEAWKRRLTVMAVVWAALGLTAAYVAENLLPAAFALASGVTVFVIARKLPRKSREAIDVFAKCKALRRWLCEFSALDERPPADVKVWGRFMVYAFVLGVAKQAMAQLRGAVPELFVRDEGLAGDNDWYVPWYAFYDDRSAGSLAGGASFAEAFATTWANTQATVSAAIAAKEASDFASSGGGGGGFSGGGGGGFGGGGGAR